MSEHGKGPTALPENTVNTYLYILSIHCSGLIQVTKMNLTRIGKAPKCMYECMYA